MLIKAEGFDDFANMDDLLLSVSSFWGANAVDVVTGRGGIGKAMRIQGDRFGTRRDAFINFPRSASQTMYFSFAFVVDSPTDTVEHFAIMDGVNSRFSVRVASGSALSFYYDGVQIGTFGNFKQFNSYIQIKYVPGGSGSIKVLVDYTTALDWSGPTANVDNIRFRATDAYVTVDDVVINDSTGSYCNTFMGDVKVLSEPVAGAGDLQEWTASAGTNPTCVDEANPNEDADYVSAPTTNLTDTYTFNPTGISAGTVQAVQVVAYARSSSGGTEKLAGVVRSGGVSQLAAEQNVSAVYQAVPFIFEVNPFTGLPWTSVEANAVQCGMKRTL